jgi:hypothetical protein
MGEHGRRDRVGDWLLFLIRFEKGFALPVRFSSARCFYRRLITIEHGGHVIPWPCGSLVWVFCWAFACLSPRLESDGPRDHMFADVAKGGTTTLQQASRRLASALLSLRRFTVRFLAQVVLRVQSETEERTPRGRDDGSNNSPHRWGCYFSRATTQTWSLSLGGLGNAHRMSYAKGKTRLERGAIWGGLKGRHRGAPRRVSLIPTGLAPGTVQGAGKDAGGCEEHCSACEDAAFA